MAHKGLIRQLPDHLVNQIAAGEVIERPASVLKELTENALDAGAAHLEIWLRQGGREEIRVTDNGAGLSRDDLLMALQRHATSKISELEDLESLQSYGFRGEALPSIASVALFEMTTRAGEEGKAWQVTRDGNRQTEAVESSHPPGTTVQVRHLFHKVPGRKKFLKAVATELKHCVETLQHFALLYPKVSFCIHHDGKLLLDLPARETLRQRVDDLYGRKLAESLEVLDAGRPAGRISGLVGPTHLHFSSRSRIQCFVNRRPVRDRLVSSALMAAYKHALPRGRFPAVFLFLEVPPDRLDVNVHPAKREVRFKDHQAVYDLISEELEKVLYAAKQVVDLTLKNPEAAMVQDRIAEAEAVFLEKHRGAASVSPRASLQGSSTPLPSAPHAVSLEELPALDQLPSALQVGARGGKGDCFRGQVVKSRVGGLMVLGQLYNTFILAQDEKGLLLVDQHVAHERILYEKFRKKQMGQGLRSSLLTPLVLDYGVGESGKIAAHLADLAAVGLELEPFGPGQWRVMTHPAHLPAKHVEAYARDCVEIVLADGGKKASLTEEKLFIMAACRSAIMANHPLKREEMESLLEELFSTAAPLTCPHGRPGVLRLGFQDLLKFFTRP